MAKTVKGKKVVPVKPYTRKVDGKKVWVKRHKRSTPANRPSAVLQTEPTRAAETDRQGRIAHPNKVLLFLFCRQHAIIRLLSLLITFIFWVTVVLFAAFLKLFGVISLDFWDLLNLIKALSIFGITPLCLTALSWRFFERYCLWFVRRRQFRDFTP